MSSPSTLAVPAGGASRLLDVPGVGFVVVVAADPDRVTLDALEAAGTVSLFMPHAAGVQWPDALGEALAATVIAAGGVLALGFTRYADALAARNRIEASRT